MSSNGWLLVIGVVVGAASAGLEAFIDVRRSRRVPPERREGLPPVLLVFLGLLVVAGVVSLVLSWLLTASLGPGLVMGAGVGIGFFAGFTILFLAGLSRERSGGG